jgi:hypothetical protein
MSAVNLNERALLLCQEGPFYTRLLSRWQLKCAAEPSFGHIPACRNSAPGRRAVRLRCVGGGVRRYNRGHAGGLLRMRGRPQPPSPQPRVRHAELRVTTIMANKNIRLRQDGRMAERPRPIPVQPDLCRNEGKIFGFTFWASHNTPQRHRNTKDAKRTELLENSTLPANRRAIQRKL